MNYDESSFAWRDDLGPVELDPASLTRLRVEVEDGVAVLTLDRPERRNAIDGATLVELTRALHHCDRSDEVVVVVLTGAGAVFCAGSELTDDGFGGEAAADGADELPWLSPWQVRKPVLAALNGHAVGAGLTLAMQCDVRYVAADAILSFPFVRLGVVGEWMGHWTAVRHLGVARAAELFLTGRRFSGADAAAWGLAAQAFPSPDVSPAVRALAREMVDHASPVSLALTKRLLWEAATTGPQEAGRHERLLLEAVLAGPDAREGVAAYLARRSPTWTGRPGADLPEWPDPG